MGGDTPHEDFCVGRIHGDCCGKECDCLLGPAVDALRAVVDAHQKAVALGVVDPDAFGDGRCRYCGVTELLGEFGGAGWPATEVTHHHVNPEPRCATCTEGWGRPAVWPCFTVRAVAHALGVPLVVMT